MREEYDDLMVADAEASIDERIATDRAVVEGIANTGRLVTSAALILFFAFIALSTVPAIEVKVLTRRHLWEQRRRRRSRPCEFFVTTSSRAQTTGN